MPELQIRDLVQGDLPALPPLLEALGYPAPVLHWPTPVGRITGIAVLPASRGTGVGARLVSAAEEHFTVLGLERFEVTSRPTHRPAYALYRRLGYGDQGVRFAKPLLRLAPR